MIKYSLNIKINIRNIIECVCRTTIFYKNKVAKPKNKKLAEKLFLAFSNILILIKIFMNAVDTNTYLHILFKGRLTMIIL